MMHQVSEVPHLSVQNHRLSRIDGFPVVPQNVDYLCNAKTHIAFLKHLYTKHTNYFQSFIQYPSLYTYIETDNYQIQLSNATSHKCFLDNRWQKMGNRQKFKK